MALTVNFNVSKQPGIFSPVSWMGWMTLICLRSGSTRRSVRPSQIWQRALESSNFIDLEGRRIIFLWIMGEVVNACCGQTSIQNACIDITMLAVYNSSLTGHFCLKQEPIKNVHFGYRAEYPAFLAACTCVSWTPCGIKLPQMDSQGKGRKEGSHCLFNCSLCAWKEAVFPWDQQRNDAGGPSKKL